MKLQESEREKSGGEAGRDRGPGVRRSEAPAPVERESERAQHCTYAGVARRDGAQWRPVNQDLKARREYRTKILMVTGLPKYNRPTGEWVRQQFEGTRIFEDVKIKDGGVTQFQTRNGFQMTQVEVESEEVATLVLRRKYSLRQAALRFARVHIFPHRSKELRSTFQGLNHLRYGAQRPPRGQGAQFPFRDQRRYQGNGGWRGHMTWPPRPEGRRL